MHITVQGAHSITIPPQRADLHFGVETEAGSREKAIKATTATAEALGATLAGLSGVESHSVGPLRVHSWRPTDAQGRPQAERVTARVDLTGVFSDFEQLSSFAIEAGGRAGVQLGWVAWSVTDEERARVQADVLGRAIGQARARALAIAEADGGGDVEILEVADPGLLGGGDVTPAYAQEKFRAMAMSSDTGASALNIVPEDVDVTEVVHVRFRVVEKHPRPRRSQ